MVVAAILAGGVGSRMGNTKTPKQYLMLGSKPIIVHTIEKFYIHPNIDKIIVLCPKPWVLPTSDIVVKYLGENDKVKVIQGGETRNDTLMCALKYINSEFGMDDDTVIVTHDAVRPFVTHRIIEENIECARKFGACDTVVSSTDTIVESEDNSVISTIPNRKKMYQGQTPQTFMAKKLMNICESLTDEEKENLTDACKIYTIKGECVKLVKGEVFNLKITYPYDLKVASVMLEGVTDDD